MKIAMTTECIWYGESGEVINDIQDHLQVSFLGSAQRIEADAKANVPRSADPKAGEYPGHLQDTIRAVQARQKRYKPSAYIFAGDQFGKFTGQEVYWHHMVEYGTYYRDAHPYLRPAADKNFNPALAEAAHATQRAVNAQRRARKEIRSTSEIYRTSKAWKEYWKTTGQ